MNAVQDILYNVTGQSLVFDAPEGRPDSITSSEVFAVTDDDDQTAESALSGSAAVETNPDTTFDAASGYGQSDPRICYLTATTGAAVGRVYLATNSTGEKEWVEVREISSGASVTARHALHNAYTSADTFESTRISHAFLDAWVQDESNVSAYNDPNPQWRWRLEYVVSSVTYVHAVFFDLVRYKGAHTVTGVDVDLEYPGWLNALQTEYRQDQGAALINRAYRAVKMHLHQHQKADQMARNPEVVDLLVVHEAGKYFDPERATALYAERFNNLITAPKIPFDDGGQGASSDASPAPIWRR